MAELTIGEVAERCGLATSAIRYYERQKLIPRADRRSGRRVYDESIVDRLSLIELAKSAGFTLAEVKTLVAGFTGRTPPKKRWRTLTRDKMSELDARIAEAERMKSVLRVLMRCECPTLTDCGRALRTRRA